MNILDLLTKDWRHMAVTGLSCFVGFAFIGAHTGGNANGVAEQAVAVTELDVNEAFNQIAAEVGVNTSAQVAASDEHIDGRKAFNPTQLTVVIQNAACEYWGNIGKYLNLKVAGQDDIASKLDCLSLKKGSKGTFVDNIGEQYTQILVNVADQKLLLWMRSDFLKDDRQIAVGKECNLFDISCVERVASGFIAKY